MLEKANILVVDDNKQNRDILVELVKSLGHKTVEAENGREAFKKVKEVMPDMVLLDIQMPDWDGYKTLSQIKGTESLKHIPVIMVTAVEEVDSIVKCIEKGADDYLTKPVEPEILKARVHNSLEKLRYSMIEKELLEKTLTGSIKILAEVLSIVNPATFGKSSRIRSIVSSISKQMKIEDPWVVEVASMLSMIGYISFTPDILEKLSKGDALLPNEKQIYDKHTEVAYKLLANIPRLEEIANIIRYQNKHYDGRGEPKDNVSKDSIPIGSRILHVILDFDKTVMEINNPLKAIEELRNRMGCYDAKIIDSLEVILLDDLNRELKPLIVDEIRHGMIFAQDVITENGQRVVGKGQEATDAIISRIRNIAIRIKIKEPINVFVKKGW